MRGRSFVILVILAAAICSYAYFVESKRDTTDESKKKGKVFAVDAGKIESLTVHAAAGDVTSVKKAGDAWQIVSPEPMDADATDVSALASTLESVEIQRVVDEKPASVAAFGLEPAHVSVTFKVTGDAATHHLDLGNKTPTGADLYAQADGHPGVFLVSSFVEDSLNRATFDLQDKTALKFARDGAESLTLEATGTPTLAFAKKGPEWRLMSPVDAAADFSAVDGVIGRLVQLKMKSIVKPGSRPTPEPPGPPKPGEPAKPAITEKKPATPDKKAAPVVETKPGAGFSDADLKAYGLDKPQATTIVGVGSTRATLVIGGRYDETTVYARDLSRPIIFTVEKGLLDDVKRKADDFRVKDVFEFRTFSANEVALTYGGTTYTFVKQKAAAAASPAGKDQPAPVETWKQTTPAAKDVNQTKLNDMLTAFSNLHADKFADKPLAAGQDLVIVAKFGGDGVAAKEERVTLRKAGDVVQAIHTGETSPAIVSTADFTKAVALLMDIASGK